MSLTAPCWLALGVGYFCRCLQTPPCLLAVDVSMLLPACGRPWQGLLLAWTHCCLSVAALCCLAESCQPGGTACLSLANHQVESHSTAGTAQQHRQGTIWRGYLPHTHIRKHSPPMAALHPAEHAAALAGGSKTLTQPPGTWVCTSTPVWSWTAPSACSWRHLTLNSQAAASHACGS